MKYLIADNHFGHFNIIRYCNRPFTSVEEMNEEMIRRWNATVSPVDEVLHLGDFALGPSDKVREYRNRLNGSLTLVMGNHDRSSMKFWHELGVVVYKRPFEYKGVLFSHAPIMHPDLPNVHGHTHENNTNIAGIHICVSVEQINYTPISIDKIRERVAHAQQVVLDGQNKE